MSQTIFFAHANGFPSATYGKLFSALEPDYRVRHLEQHGHDPRFPVDDNWNNLVDELILHVEQGSEPVWASWGLGGAMRRTCTVMILPSTPLLMRVFTFLK